MRLTEMMEAIKTPAADLNRELYTHIDLVACNDQIIQARKEAKKAKLPENPLFG